MHQQFQNDDQATNLNRPTHNPNTANSETSIEAKAQPTKWETTKRQIKPNTGNGEVRTRAKFEATVKAKTTINKATTQPQNGQRRRQHPSPKPRTAEPTLKPKCQPQQSQNGQQRSQNSSQAKVRPQTANNEAKPRAQLHVQSKTCQSRATPQAQKGQR